MLVGCATNCARLLLQDGGDAPLEDQPEAARQARHHQNLVSGSPPTGSNSVRFFSDSFRSADFCLSGCCFSEEILNPSVPMALRLSGILMGEFDFQWRPQRFFLALFGWVFMCAVLEMREQVA